MKQPQKQSKRRIVSTQFFERSPGNRELEFGWQNRVVAMIQMSLVALSIVLIGLQCKRLTAQVASGLRPTDLYSPARMRAILAQARRQREQS